MDESILTNNTQIYFVYDFKGPGGYIPFGYTRYTFPFVIQNKLEDIDDKNFVGYNSRIQVPYEFEKHRTAEFANYIVEHTKNTNFILTSDVVNRVDEKAIYFVTFESLNVNNMFEYYSYDGFNLKDFLSPNLLNLLKENENFKILFIDSGEGAYPHTFELLEKINNFLETHDIQHENKVLISSNNNFILDLKNNKKFIKYKNKINLYTNNFLLLTAGRFIGELRARNNSLTENDYKYSLQTELLKNEKEKYFLMYNRNSDRLHRSYFVNKLYTNNLLEKGFVSFFENPYFESFIETNNEYPNLNLTNDDISDIRNNYKNYYPLFIDSTDSEIVAELHNFLSRKDEYEKSYFTIVSETNAESDYCFITEKTTKPISNLHPFVIVGNPHTLKILKSYGFQTFDRWWDESYDNEFNFKKRTDMVLDVVRMLCNKSKSEWIQMLIEMESILYQNQKLLHKLSTKQIYQKEFFKAVFQEKQMI